MYACMILVPICILYNFQMTIASAGHQKGCNSIKSKAIVPRGGGLIQRRLRRQWLPICYLQQVLHFRPKLLFFNILHVPSIFCWVQKALKLCFYWIAWITLLHMGLVSQLSYWTGIAPLQSTWGQLWRT
jgi:hypothetical protein